MRKRGLWMMALLAMAVVAQAEDVIYRSQDADGKPSFSDRPGSGAKPVELPPVNTVQPPAAPPRSADAKSEQAPASYAVALNAPSTVPNGLVPTPIGIEVEPALRPGHRWQLVLDGEVVAEGDGAAHSLGSLSRGPHELLLRVVDGRGTVLASDGPVQMFVLRPGKN